MFQKNGAGRRETVRHNGNADNGRVPLLHYTTNNGNTERIDEYNQRVEAVCAEEARSYAGNLTHQITDELEQRRRNPAISDEAARQQAGLAAREILVRAGAQVHRMGEGLEEVAREEARRFVSALTERVGGEIDRATFHDTFVGSTHGLFRGIAGLFATSRPPARAVEDVPEQHETAARAPVRVGTLLRLRDRFAHRSPRRHQHFHADLLKLTKAALPAAELDDAAARQHARVFVDHFSADMLENHRIYADTLDNQRVGETVRSYVDSVVSVAGRQVLDLEKLDLEERVHEFCLELISTGVAHEREAVSLIRGEVQEFLHGLLREGFIASDPKVLQPQIEAFVGEILKHGWDGRRLIMVIR